MKTRKRDGMRRRVTTLEIFIRIARGFNSKFRLKFVGLIFLEINETEERAMNVVIP